VRHSATVLVIEVFSRTKSFTTQATINNMFKRGVREETCSTIASNIPFNGAKSEEFSAMFDLVSRHGLAFKL